MLGGKVQQAKCRVKRLTTGQKHKKGGEIMRYRCNTLERSRSHTGGKHMRTGNETRQEASIKIKQGTEDKRSFFIVVMIT